MPTFAVALLVPLEARAQAGQIADAALAGLFMLAMIALALWLGPLLFFAIARRRSERRGARNGALRTVNAFLIALPALVLVGAVFNAGICWINTSRRSARDGAEIRANFIPAIAHARSPDEESRLIHERDSALATIAYQPTSCFEHGLWDMPLLWLIALGFLAAAVREVRGGPRPAPHHASPEQREQVRQALAAAFGEGQSAASREGNEGKP